MENIPKKEKFQIKIGMNRQKCTSSKQIRQLNIKTNLVFSL